MASEKAWRFERTWIRTIKINHSVSIINLGVIWEDSHVRFPLTVSVQGMNIGWCFGVLLLLQITT